MIRVLLILAVALLAWPAAAACPDGTSCFTNCSSTPKKISATSIDNSKVNLCWEFDETAALDEISLPLNVKADSALVCFDPDKGTEGTAVATLQVHRCVRSRMPATNPEFECTPMLDGAGLTGLGGAAGTQNTCFRVSAGLYYLRIATASVAEDAVASIQGEGS